MLDAFATALLFYPLVFCAVLYGEWLIGWHALGHAPRPGLDDPKDIVEIGTLHVVTGVLLMGLLPAALLALVSNVAAAMRSRRRWIHLGLRLGAVLLAWPLVIGLLRWDPIRVAAWWFD